MGRFARDGYIAFVANLSKYVSIKKQPNTAELPTARRACLFKHARVGVIKSLKGFCMDSYTLHRQDRLRAGKRIMLKMPGALLIYTQYFIAEY